ncbi:2'-5' RNA ligase family protein [Gordonia sputi]|uniref:2'-5' RNA ligase family protein n=1 Tax=Gordonia sputi TaxID=36823 RepID=UPI0022705F8B|nr:2'-5' RNA ligase family protein [Gordonia sputi]
MAHSVEFLFDEDSERRLRALWDALAASNLPNAGRNPSPTNRPHVTAAATHRIDAAADHAIHQCAETLPIPVTLGAPLVFGRDDRLVVALLVVPTARLLAAHVRVVEALYGHAFTADDEPGVFSHSLPGSWTPHVTMARRVHSDALGDVMAALDLPSHSGRPDGTPATITAIRRWDGDSRTDVVLGKRPESSEWGE